MQDWCWGCFKVVHTRINDADVLMMDLDAVAFKVHSFALSCSSSVVFVVGFLLNKYVVFTGSYLKGKDTIVPLLPGIRFQFFYQLFFITGIGAVPACSSCIGAGNCNSYCCYDKLFYAAVFYI